MTPDLELRSRFRWLVLLFAIGCGSTGSGGTSSAGGSQGTGGAASTGGAPNSPPPSCEGLAPNCGSASSESCCTSLLVNGGNFYRSYDDRTYTDQSYPATVSDFRLDKFEITVGRFRRFVDAWNNGWRPPSGAGKHTHLNGGNGVTNSSGTTTYEQGWDTSWSLNAILTDASLQCDSQYQTWTPSAAGNENLPIVCENWFEAYAFCIWDDGFLPTEAEWNYAAAGGSEQRVFPWSNPPSSATIDCTYANDDPSCSSGPNRVGSESPKGDGKYGQSDLSGNVWEWNLDWYGTYVVPCSNCAYLPAGSQGRLNRGGGFTFASSGLLISNRGDLGPDGRDYSLGARCARSP